MPPSPDAPPSTTEALGELLLHWQELRRRGEAPKIADLCRGCPELAAELEKQVRALESMEALLALDPGVATGPLVPTPDGPADTRDGPGPSFPVLPGFEILAELAQGGMGVVYKARQPALHRLVAIKMIRAGLRARPEQLARFRTEAEALARAQHPNMVLVHEVGDCGGQPYLVMEYVEGGSLAQRLARSLLPVRQAANWTETLARAIHAAHERGIVHRDLKPGNVLLQMQSAECGVRSEMPASAICVPKITDFGLAKCLDTESGHTRTGEILGTPSYLAPEQADGKTRDVGPAADTYALGAILYEMITGRPPFQGESTLDTLEQVRRREPVPPSRLQPRVPRDLETICLKCLEKEPARRYASAQDLAEDLRRFQAGEPIRARSASAWEHGVKWVKRRPAQALASGVVGLALIVLLALWAAFTAQLRFERDRARFHERQALEQERIARQNQEQADRERDRARRQSERAEAILIRCVSDVDEQARAAINAKEERLRTGEPGSLLFVLARSFAASSASSREDPTLTPDDRAQLAKEYADRALDMLEKARQLGYFANPANREKLRTDRELEPLRARPDFREVAKKAGLPLK